MQTITVATVTPVYKGEEYLDDLVREIRRVRTSWAEDAAPMALVEAIFVDDGSIDRSAEVLARLSERHPWIRVVTLARNFGQHPATIAGLLHTSSDWVVTLDEDLQHHPDRIELLLRLAVTEHYDIVYANPENPVHQSRLRDLGSRTSKRLIALLAGNPKIRFFNSFRLVRGAVARAAASVCAHDTYFDVALSWFSDRIGTVSLPMKDNRFIETKTSGYSLHGLLSHARRMVMSSQTKVLRGGGLVGGLAILLAATVGVWVFVARLVDPHYAEVPGWTSLFLAIFFFGGVSCLLIGVALEYLTTVLLRMQGKPTYFEVVRFGDRSLREYFEAKRE